MMSRMFPACGVGVNIDAVASRARGAAKCAAASRLTAQGPRDELDRYMLTRTSKALIAALAVASTFGAVRTHGQRLRDWTTQPSAELAAHEPIKAAAPAVLK